MKMISVQLLRKYEVLQGIEVGIFNIPQQLCKYFHVFSVSIIFPDLCFFACISTSPQRKSSLSICSNQFYSRLQILLLFFGIVTKQDRRNWGKGSDFVGSVYPIPNKGTDNAHNTTTNPPPEFSDLPPALQVFVSKQSMDNNKINSATLSKIHWNK